MTDDKIKKTEQYKSLANLTIGYGIGYNKVTPYKNLIVNIESAVELAINDLGAELEELDTDTAVEFFTGMEDAIKLALKNYLVKYTDTGVIDES